MGGGRGEEGVGGVVNRTAGGEGHLVSYTGGRTLSTYKNTWTSLTLPVYHGAGAA